MDGAPPAHAPLRYGAVRLSTAHPPAPLPSPRPFVVRLFDRYCRSQLARHFATTRVLSLSDAGRWDLSIPTLLLANHTSWWDGPLALVVGGHLGLRTRLLMEAANLERYPAFRRAGAIPIRRTSSRAAYDDLLAAGAALTPGGALWVFPQGARRPRGERPRLERGAAELALAGAPLRVCCVAFRYLHLGEQLPEAFVLLGRPRLIERSGYRDRRALAPVLEQDLLAALDAVDGLLQTENVASFRTIVQGRLSINKRMDRLRHAIGLLPGPFEARNG